MAEEESDSIFSEEEWGGAENNIIMPAANIIAALLGLPPAPIPPNPFAIHSPVSAPVSASPPRLSGQVRRRDEQHPLATIKALREENGGKILSELVPPNRYIKLASGEELFFSEEDGKNLLLNSISEPDELVRNIISKIPVTVIDRMEYLAKFQQPSVTVASVVQEDLKERVYAAYIKEWRLRFLFRKLLIKWRIKKMDKSAEKEVDPITLSEPEKEVHVYDWTNRRKFIFDARSLSTLIETKLMYQEYGFPIPQAPKNPKNNVEFTYGQLISIYNQCQEQGELRWGLTTLRQYNFNKSRWQLYHKSALTMNSIKTSIMTLDNFEARELFSDFIFAKMDELGFKYNNYVFNAYQVAMTSVPNHWYLEKLKSWAALHYEAEHFGHNKTRIINAACLRIFKKHLQFIADLKAKNVI